TGGTFVAGTGTVDFTGAGTERLNSGGQAFNNLTHSGAGTLRLVGNPLTVTGTLGNAAGGGDFQAHNPAGPVPGPATRSGAAPTPARPRPRPRPAGAPPPPPPPPPRPPPTAA